MSDAKEINIADLQALVNGAQGTRSTMWKGTFYCGTSDGFHFLKHRIKTRPDLFLKIKAAQLCIVAQIDYTSDESNWIEVSHMIPEARN
jgi:hypothetical protein